MAKIALSRFSVLISLGWTNSTLFKVGMVEVCALGMLPVVCYNQALMFVFQKQWCLLLICIVSYIRSYFVYVAYISGSTWVNIWSIRWAWKYSALKHTQTQQIHHDHHSKVYFTDEYMYESPGINVITLFEVLYVCRLLETSLLHRMLTVVRPLEQYPKHI